MDHKRSEDCVKFRRISMSSTMERPIDAAADDRTDDNVRLERMYFVDFVSYAVLVMRKGEVKGNKGGTHGHGRQVTIEWPWENGFCLENASLRPRSRRRIK